MMGESGVHVDDAIYSDVWYSLFFFSHDHESAHDAIVIVAQHRTA